MGREGIGWVSEKIGWVVGFGEFGWMVGWVGGGELVGRTEVQRV